VTEESERRLTFEGHEHGRPWVSSEDWPLARNARRKTSAFKHRLGSEMSEPLAQAHQKLVAYLRELFYAETSALSIYLSRFLVYSIQNLILRFAENFLLLSVHSMPTFLREPFPPAVQGCDVQASEEDGLTAAENSFCNSLLSLIRHMR
jgi:hypothetical protein